MAKRSRVGRRAGEVLYPGKTRATSINLTPATYRMLEQADKRTGKSKSDIVEHVLRNQLPTITRL